MHDSMAFNLSTIRVENAFIEEIYIDRGTGHVTISYDKLGDSDIIYNNVITLLVSQQTVIRDQFGQDLSLWDLKEGMIIDAIISPVMTRSIPPQSRAFNITVINNMDYSVTIDHVLRVELINRFLYTGEACNPINQIRFVITPSTLILDREGKRINLWNIRPGQTVRVEHATFQTASIPPQTTAFRLQIL